MPLQTIAQFRKVAAALLLSSAFVACGGGAALPERKKFPMFTDTGLAGDIPLYAFATQDSKSGMPFATGYVDLSTEGSSTSYYSIALPDNSYDSLALSLVNNYKPLALPLISQWIKQSGGTGFMLDLRSSSNSGNRVDYTVNVSGITVPVVLLWDNRSASRAETFVKLLQQTSGVSISSKNQTSAHSCF